MSKVERSIVIERPIEAVWDYVHDPANDPTWQTTVMESELLTEGAVGPGTRIREVRRFLGARIEVTYDVTVWEPPAKSTVTSVSGPVPFTGSYLLEPADGGTRLTVTGDIEGHGFFKLGEPVFRRMAARELETNLGHLKDLLEAR